MNQSEIWTKEFLEGTYLIKRSFGLDAVSILNGGAVGAPDIQILGTKKVGEWASEPINVSVGNSITPYENLGLGDFSIIVPAGGKAVVIAK